MKGSIVPAPLKKHRGETLLHDAHGMITDYEVKLASVADAQEISELSRDAIEHGLQWNWTARRVARCIADNSTNVAIARRGAALAGFAVMKYGEDDAHILLLAVHPAHRRKGLGSALLAWLEATARTAGIDLIGLEVRAGNAGALSFYRRHGYREMGVRRGYYQGVEDAVWMAKDLWEAD